MSTGNKYHRRINSVESIGGNIQVDVYSVLEAFRVECPARQHAIKKLLCASRTGISCISTCRSWTARVI